MRGGAIYTMKGKSPGPCEPQSGHRASHSGQRASYSDQRVSQSNQKVSGRCEMLSGRCDMLCGRFEARSLPGFFPPCYIQLYKLIRLVGCTDSFVCFRGQILETKAGDSNSRVQKVRVVPSPHPPPVPVPHNSI